MNHADAAVVPRVSVTDRAAAIRAAVIYNQKLKILQRLFLYAFYRAGHIPFHLIYRHDHADFWLAHPYTSSFDAFLPRLLRRQAL
jgi:hypothetical protein